MPAKSLELKYIINFIQEIASGIDKIEAETKSIMNSIHSPILAIPDISYRISAMILVEIGDFSQFASSDKILAYAEMASSPYQSGQLDNCYSNMQKRGFRYFCYALYNVTRYVCYLDPTFAIYLEKKHSEGKHYNIGLSHVTKTCLNGFPVKKIKTGLHQNSLANKYLLLSTLYDAQFVMQFSRFNSI